MGGGTAGLKASVGRSAARGVRAPHVLHERALKKLGTIAPHAAVAIATCAAAADGLGATGTGDTGDGVC